MYLCCNIQPSGTMSHSPFPKLCYAPTAQWCNVMKIKTNVLIIMFVIPVFFYALLCLFIFFMSYFLSFLWKLVILIFVKITIHPYSINNSQYHHIIITWHNTIHYIIQYSIMFCNLTISTSHSSDSIKRIGSMPTVWRKTGSFGTNNITCGIHLKKGILIKHYSYHLVWKI